MTVLTTSEQTARQCYGVLRGCDAVVMPSLESQDAVISAVIEDLKTQGKVSSGDPIVIVQGTNPVRGATSMMRISYGKLLFVFVADCPYSHFQGTMQCMQRIFPDFTLSFFSFTTT